MKIGTAYANPADVIDRVLHTGSDAVLEIHDGGTPISALRVGRGGFRLTLAYAA